MSQPSGMFIGLRRDRLGARLLMMLTCVRLAEDYGTDYRINWFPKGADAPELNRPEELFETAWMDRTFISSVDFDVQSESGEPIWKFQNDPDPSRLKAHLASGRAVIVEEGFEVLAFPWEDIEAIRSRYRDYIDRFGFQPNIRRQMDRIKAALFEQGSSAYHIRRGDILNGLPWKHSIWSAKIEPEEYYARHLEKMGDKPAIMFSDQPETLARFQADYPHLKTMADIADLSDLTRAQRDFLELYAMSQADRVVAPIISAFSMAAARISGRQRLMFRDVLETSEMAEANQHLLDRVHQGPDAFLNPSEAAHLYAKLHQYLSAEGRAQEAYDLAQPILEAGAENAFLPMFQAINCFYLGRWQEGVAMANLGLSNAHLWPVDFAVLAALKGVMLGAQRKRWAAGRAFSQGFWAKSTRPDVVVLGARMLYRNQLPERLFPPVDWELLKHLRQPWYPPFNNLYLVQWQAIQKRPCNFDMVLLDWPDFSLDQKASRLSSEPPRLALLQQWLEKITDFSVDAPERRSLQAMLNFRLGDLSAAKAIDETRKAIADAPTNPLYHKRLADLHEAYGDDTGARASMADALSLGQENPFLLFTMGRLLQRLGARDMGEAQILLAAELDHGTAAIQGEAGQIAMKRGDTATAEKYLTEAQKLCPSFKRFGNQLARIG